jgi:hypothetical protein
MWRIDCKTVGLDTARWKIRTDDESVLTFQALCASWRSDAAFRRFWVAGLRDAPFDAYAWECPPVTAGSVAREFECVFVSSPMLARTEPDPQAFAEHFRPGRSVVTFANLGGDAVLVAPCPGAPGSDFSHLASFSATATSAQQDALWQAVGRAMEMRIGAKPVWVSTAGLGVAWLHVRLDDRPKYYRHMPYASERA